MSSIPTELAAILGSVERPGSFYAAGAAEIYMPSLEVEGVGPIALPLLPMQAEQLVAVAERAPYGRGEETLVDTTVRRTWQIGADKIQIRGKYWAQNIGEIVAWIAARLGVSEPVTAELYKLLVYDAGSFFVGHRDTEKAPGMFATLVLVLPSLYSGGELLVRHRGQEARLDLHEADSSELAFAAFYADCVHEVLPVTSGCRLTLIYNLLRTDLSPLEPPEYGEEQGRLAERLRQWGKSKGSSGDESPEKLIYPLEHAYTPAELSFTALKGADAARGAVAVAAAEQADCELHLALVSIRESGWAEHSDYPSRRGRSRGGEDAFEIGEVCDRRQFLSDWRKPDGSQPAMDNLPFEAEELCPPDAFEGLEPDEQHFQEATGNEGASFERTYARAALIFWPRARRLAVLNQAGLFLTLPYLNELAERWARNGENGESTLWQEAHELSGHMMRTWPREEVYSPWHTRGSNASTSMLASLVLLRDTARIETFLAEVSAAGFYGMADNEKLVQAAGLLPPARAAELIERIIAKNAQAMPGACADLLARCAVANLKDESALKLIPAATTLVEALPGGVENAPPPRPWLRPAVDPGFIVNLMIALNRIEAGLADRAVDCVLARPTTYGLDAILVPAALRLAEQAETRSAKAVERLFSACLEHLRARIAEPLEPPSDWKRASTLACQCRYCAELSRFLADPASKTWPFQAAAAERSHVEHSVRQNGCDLTLTTQTRGRPYTLICTKNQASHERRVSQRKKDLQDLAALERP
ncbi:MAG: 2OG-Fe(II) oxygenase [Methylococcaceae bacterium]|nr:2OG-Fe(II) oxygenase [Methylococcaceae bacterium]